MSVRLLLKMKLNKEIEVKCLEIVLISNQVWYFCNQIEQTQTNILNKWKLVGY